MSVVLFGCAMVKAVREWSSEKGIPVDCRVGVHTGECVGGLVGVEMKRYHLFGKLLASVESLESTAPSGFVHMSRACEEALVKQKHTEGLSSEILSYSERAELRLQTSKGEPVEYEEVGGGPTFIVRDVKADLYDSQPSNFRVALTAASEVPDIPHSLPDPSPESDVDAEHHAPALVNPTPPDMDNIPLMLPAEQVPDEPEPLEYSVVPPGRVLTES
jgi:hypothetical protein